MSDEEWEKFGHDLGVCIAVLIIIGSIIGAIAGGI